MSFPAASRRREWTVDVDAIEGLWGGSVLVLLCSIPPTYRIVPFCGCQCRTWGRQVCRSVLCQVGLFSTGITGRGEFCRFIVSRSFEAQRSDSGSPRTWSTCIRTFVVQRQKYRINRFLVDRKHLTWWTLSFYVIFPLLRGAENRRWVVEVPCRTWWPISCRNFFRFL